MKKLLTSVTAAILSLSVCLVSYAGTWKKDGTGYRYMSEDGSYLTDSLTPDGYYVNADGYWNGSGNDVTARYSFLGTRLFRSHGDAVLQEDGYWYFTADVFDLSFFDENTLKSFRVNDTVLIPGLNITAQVTTIRKAHLVTEHSRTTEGTVTSKKTSSDYMVLMSDADGNRYSVTAKHIVERTPDNTRKLLARPVASDIPMKASKYRIVIGFGKGTTPTMEELAKSTTLYFRCTLKDSNSVDDVYDNAINDPVSAASSGTDTAAETS